MPLTLESRLTYFYFHNSVRKIKLTLLKAGSSRLLVTHSRALRKTGFLSGTHSGGEFNKKLPAQEGSKAISGGGLNLCYLSQQPPPVTLISSPSFGFAVSALPQDVQLGPCVPQRLLSPRSLLDAALSHAELLQFHKHTFSSALGPCSLCLQHPHSTVSG